MKLDVNEINTRWAKQSNIDAWSQLNIKHTKDTNEYVTKAPVSGIYKMLDKGKIKFDRMDTHRRAVESDTEAFFLRITRKDDYLYEEADMGILVTRGRMMKDDFKLTKRATDWINALRAEYVSHPVEEGVEVPVLIGSLTK